MGYFTATFVFVQKKGGVVVIVGGMLKSSFYKAHWKSGEITRKLRKKRIGEKLNSCSHDIHVFMPARRQFSVQTGIIWKGV